MNFFRNHWNDFAAPPKGCKKNLEGFGSNVPRFCPIRQKDFPKALGRHGRRLRCNGAARPALPSLSAFHHRLHKIRMHRQVARQFGMERAGQHVPFAGCHDTAAHDRQHFHVPPRLHNVRSAYENHGNGLPGKRALREEAPQLPPVCIAPHGDVHHLQMPLLVVFYLIGQQNHTGARAEHGQTLHDSLPQEGGHAQAAHQLPDGSAFASRKNQPVHRGGKVFPAADLEMADAQTAYSGGYPFSISGDIRSVPS